MNTNMHGDKTMARNIKNGSEGQGGRWRIAAWGVAVMLLLLPWLAGAPWGAFDYVFAGMLLFGVLGAIEVAVRMTGDTTYRAAVGVALAAMLLLIWSNAAVGITDGDADLMFFLLVPTVAILCAIVARFEPRGMSYAMFAAAFTQAFIAGMALVAGIVPAFNSAFEVLGITAFFVALFVGSGLLFRDAAIRGSERATV